MANPDNEANATIEYPADMSILEVDVVPYQVNKRCQKNKRHEEPGPGEHQQYQRFHTRIQEMNESRKTINTSENALTEATFATVPSVVQSITLYAKLSVPRLTGDEKAHDVVVIPLVVASAHCPKYPTKSPTSHQVRRCKDCPSNHPGEEYRHCV